MKSATIFKPPSNGLKAVFCFPSEPNTPEGPEYIDVRGEVMSFSKVKIYLRKERQFLRDMPIYFFFLTYATTVFVPKEFYVKLNFCCNELEFKLNDTKVQILLTL